MLIILVSSQVSNLIFLVFERGEAGVSFSSKISLKSRLLREILKVNVKGFVEAKGGRFL